MRVARILPLVLIGAAGVTVPETYGQDPNWAGAAAAAADVAGDPAEREALAESILAAREAASGRAFDPGYRAASRKALARKPLKELEAIQARGDAIGSALVAGSRQQELVYTPVTPCRIIDTRAAGGALAAASTRSFKVAGGSYSSQGGSATNCGIPFGPTTAAVVNFVAVSPAGPGDLRVTPYGTAMPLASILNYAAVTGLNIANGPVVTICNPGTTTCTYDITVQADAAAVHVVADVQGYFSRQDAAVTVDFVTNGSQTFSAAGWTELLASTITLPDKCIGVADSWTVLVSTSGYVYSTTADTLARLGLSEGSSTTIEGGTLTNASVAPGDDRSKPYHVQWVFSGLGSGAHTFRTLAEALSGSYTAYWNRMVVQVLGNTCP